MSTLKLNFTLYGHASVLISYGDLSILTDPWFKDNGNHGTFYSVPPVKVPTAEEIQKINALQISHNHTDHFCAESLSVFPKNIPIFITKRRDQVFFKQITVLGFTNIIEILPGYEGVSFGPLQLYQYPSSDGSAYDSALIVRADSEYYYLNNDAIFTARTYAFFKAVFGTFKGCFLGYSHFAVYPIAYDYDSCETLKLDRVNERILKGVKESAWDHVSLVCRQLGVKWVVPYACGVRLLNKDTLLFNEMFNDPKDIYSVDMGGAQAHIIWPGDKIDANGCVEKHSTVELQPPISPELVRPATTRLMSECEVKSRRFLFEDGLLSLISHESKRWLAPMKVQIRIITTENPIVFNFVYDGQTALSEKVAEAAADRDLVIDYPSGPLEDVLVGEYKISRVHFSFTKYFRVQVNRIIYAQQEVHAWGQGWKF